MPPLCSAFIFDLDGTLLNSLDDLADTANDALEAGGFPRRAVAEFRYFVGDGIENMLRRAAPEGTDAATVAGLVERTRAEYALHWARKTRPYEGIMPMLARLRERGIALAVLSNKPHDFTLDVTAYFFPDVPFAAVQGSPPGGKAKPDPALALQVAAQIGLAPADVFFMGDTRTDMDTATAAGMTPVGVLWGFRPQSELVAHGARILLEKPDDLFLHI